VDVCVHSRSLFGRTVGCTCSLGRRASLASGVSKPSERSGRRRSGGGELAVGAAAGESRRRGYRRVRGMRASLSRWVVSHGSRTGMQVNPTAGGRPKTAEHEIDLTDVDLTG
jgi:hypothetical protein